MEDDLTCRVCFANEELMINIFDEREDLQTNLTSLLSIYGGIQVSKDDSYPKFLCEECTKELLIAVRFREKCARSNLILMDPLSKKQLKSKSPPFSPEGNNSEECFTEYSPIICDDAEINDTMSGTKFTDLFDIIEEPIPDIDENIKPLTLPDENEFIEDTRFNTNVSDNKADEINLILEESLNNEEEMIKMNNELTNSIVLSDIPSPPVTKRFVCDSCGALFLSSNTLKRHMEKSHLPLHYFSCSHCDHCFTSEKLYVEHWTICDQTAKKKFNELNTGNNLQTQNSDEHKNRCPYCDKQCKSHFALTTHLRTHTNERPFSCHLCPKAFKTLSALNTHIKRHTGDADFACEICNKAFYEQSNLKIHMRSHTGEKPHVCCICQKSFTRVFLLEGHMRVHTGEKPFQCKLCEKKFAQRCDLACHFQTHSDKRTVNCPGCSKAFYTKRALNAHIKRHPKCYNRENFVKL